MDPEKRARLEAAGWTVSDSPAEAFGLTREELDQAIAVRELAALEGRTIEDAELRALPDDLDFETETEE